MPRSLLVLLLLLASLLAGCGATGTPGAPEPTATPAATPTPSGPLPSFGDTVTFQEWVISLAKTETLAKVVYSKGGAAYTTKGQFWGVWIDAKNEQNAERSLLFSVRFSLVDDHGAAYNDFTQRYCADQKTVPEGYCQRMRDAATLASRDPLDNLLPPRTLTHPLLFFDVAADAKPAQLIIQSADTNQKDQVVFDLKAK